MDIVSIAQLVGFVVFGVLAWRFKISYRFSIASVLVLLVLAGVSTASGRDDIGNFVAFLSYYFLLVGVSLALVEYASRREQNPVAVDVRAYNHTLTYNHLWCFESCKHLHLVDGRVSASTQTG